MSPIHGFRTGETLTIADSVGPLTAALQQTFRPFWIWAENGLADTKRALGYLDGHADAAFDLTLRLVASLDSLFGAILIVLFLLAVRRRFRMA